jgi:methionyl-tRNA formyltransferase
MKWVFMGSDPIALPLLNWLRDEAAEAVTITAIYTQPDRPVGRGQKVVANEIKRWAVAHGIEVRQPVKLTPVEQAALAADQPDLALVMAYGHILRDAFISVPRFGTVNLHASLLPHLRGASPIQCAIVNGDRETGISLMRIVRELDAGPVADVERVDIAPLDTALDVEEKLAAACVPLIARNLPALVEGKLTFASQDSSQATFCRRLLKTDGGLDFSRTAGELAARINGLYPWPSCHIELAGQTIKLGLAEAIADAGKPGQVRVSPAGQLEIGTSQGHVRLLKLQRPGGRMLGAGEFLRGFPVPADTVVSSAPMPDLITRKL